MLTDDAKPVAIPASAPPPKAATNSAAALDLNAFRALAREDERQRKREPLEMTQDSQRVRAPQESKLAQDIKKARRPDCLKAYSGGPSFNVFLLIPIAIDTVTDTGCKW
jgi:hypothetical protein